MDLSSPTDQGSYSYEDMQTSTDDVFGRSVSSESSSSGREMRGVESDR